MYKGYRQEHRGDLSVSVYDQSPGKPIDNATVRILPYGDLTGNQVLEELETNPVGQTAHVNLECPPAEFSLEPGDTKPYSEYGVEISAEGFYTTLVEGIQILEDTVSIQNVYLRPLGENNMARQEDLFVIKEHTLYGDFPPKIPEAEEKPLPNATGFVVLDEPVIPEFIVVHDGLPTNNAAANYYIPFKDYIKNVASCEIYDTWPEQTIYANILAIISFTLNRVFTEWYRNQGKNFTVTSSTAYDHAFSYGRNFFENISRIVDEIFVNYITKPNIRQPLFAQYCDGNRTSCPGWLSQWGSKYLGDQGRTAIEILRNYYGSDVYLDSAQRVTGVPRSYPGQSLQAGSSGESVRTIQNQLNTIANNYPLIPKVRVDGAYGEATQKAVETFQGIFSLPANGIVDFSTWYKISEIYVAVAKLAAL